MEREFIRYDIPELNLHMKLFPITPRSRLRGMHRHREVELACIESGRVACCIGNKEFVLEPGQVLLVNSNAGHCMKYLEPTVLRYIQIELHSNPDRNGEDTYIDDFTMEQQEAHYKVFPEGSELALLFNQMKKELETKEDHYKKYLKAYIYSLIAFMYRQDMVTARQLQDYREIMPVLEFIAKNYEHRITLEQLANRIGTDKYRLCHLFKKYTGGTVVEYINFVRLRRAEQLLSDGDKNATEVASACGFASIQYFDKVFRKALGCSPSVYRKNIVWD